MPCNCGSKARNLKYDYVNAQGQVQLANVSQVQANAEKIRAGGKGEVRPVAR